MSDITQLRHAIEQGDAKAANELLTLVYDELRRVAAHQMAGEATGQRARRGGLSEGDRFRHCQSGT